MLDNWFDSNWQGPGSICGTIDMPDYVLDAIIKVNDHETVYQNADRYIIDKAMKKIYSK